MAMLSFICPTTGLKVSTGIDIDSESFKCLPLKITEIACPHCKKPHALPDVKSHLVGESLQAIRIE